MQQKGRRIDMDSISKGWCLEKKRETWCKDEHTKKRRQKSHFVSMDHTLGFTHLLISSKETTI